MEINSTLMLSQEKRTILHLKFQTAFWILSRVDGGKNNYLLRSVDESEENSQLLGRVACMQSALSRRSYVQVRQASTYAHTTHYTSVFNVVELSTLPHLARPANIEFCSVAIQQPHNY